MKIVLNTLEDTQKLAQKMAEQAKCGDVILLEGNLGAGKSTFARYFIKSLCGDETNVPSPTFTIMQSYEAKNFTIWHLDLYRIKNVAELEELGLEDLFSSSVMLIEWPEIALPILPIKQLKIKLNLDENSGVRTAEIM